MAVLNFSHLLKLSELAPSVFNMVQKNRGTKSAPKILSQLVGVAKQISGEKDFEQMIATLKEKPELLLEFHREILNLERDTLAAEIDDRQHARDRDAQLAAVGQRNFRGDIMIFMAAVGLVLCLLSLGCYHERLPGEAIGIISTVAGIFGACLKDAFAFEFGVTRPKKEHQLSDALQKYQK